MSGGTQRKVRASPLVPLNTRTPSAIMAARRPAASSMRVRVQCTVLGALQRITIGPTTRAPTASPSHHVNQMGP